MELLPIISALTAIVVASLAFWSSRQLVHRLDAALGGKEPTSLETKLDQYFGTVNELAEQLDRLNLSHEQVATLAGMASQKISIVRFNPFGDTGGDQSFCLAVLDAHNSGYILTSIHGRQGTRSYVKPIDFGQSKYTLSEEEKQAIAQAMRRTPEIIQ